MRVLLLALTTLAQRIAAHGAGAWTDPNHYNGQSYAGLRFIAEGPPHVLKLVGTDDGRTWFSLRGTCSGEHMETITFDFSSKGGPPALNGLWERAASGTTTITWPDGNAWTLIDATGPTAAMALGDGVDDHTGPFTDPNHFSSWDSFAGTRFIAEDPPHVLTLVGSDDGTSWFAVEGICSGPEMTTIELDFSPKGGPAALVGTWHAEAAGTAGFIAWPDGNEWTKVEAAGGAAALKVEGAAAARRGDGNPAQLAVVAVALLGIVGLAKGINRWRLRSQQKQDLAAFDAAVEMGHGVAGTAGAVS